MQERVFVGRKVHVRADEANPPVQLRVLQRRHKRLGLTRHVAVFFGQHVVIPAVDDLIDPQQRCHVGAAVVKVLLDVLWPLAHLTFQTSRLQISLDLLGAQTLLGGVVLSGHRIEDRQGFHSRFRFLFHLGNTEPNHATLSTWLTVRGFHEGRRTL